MPENEVKNIAYYDEIAGDYDALMDNAHSNAIVRKIVSDKFLSTIAPGSRVLDFGGGTGADLGWLTDHHYPVIFCEPSTGMKEQAILRQQGKTAHGRVDFLSSTTTDFRGWPDNPPFTPQVDAILANFAVINCIQDIEMLFRSLAIVLRPGGHLIALLLRPKMRNELRSFAGLKAETLDISYKDRRQTVYIHSAKAIRQATGPHFYFSSRESLYGSVFSLIHLTRK